MALGSWGQTVGRCAKQRVGGVGWSQSAHKEGRGQQRVHIFHGAPAHFETNLKNWPGAGPPLSPEHTVTESRGEGRQQEVKS